MTGVQLGGESDAEMEQLLTAIETNHDGGGGLFEDFGGGDWDEVHKPTLVPSESLVVQL